MSDYYFYNGELYSADDLSHHGVKGQKWGVRRYQNKDGSLTPAGKNRMAKRETEAKQHDTRSKTYADSHASAKQRLADLNKNGYESREFKELMKSYKSRSKEDFEAEWGSKKEALDWLKKDAKDDVDMFERESKKHKDIANKLRTGDISKRTPDELLNRYSAIAYGKTIAIEIASVGVNYLLAKHGVISKGKAVVNSVATLPVALITSSISSYRDPDKAFLDKNR